MTFHREKEQIGQLKSHRQPQTTTFMSIHQQEQKEKEKEKNENTNKQVAEENNVLKQK